MRCADSHVTIAVCNSGSKDPIHRTTDSSSSSARPEKVYRIRRTKRAREGGNHIPLFMRRLTSGGSWGGVHGVMTPPKSSERVI